MRLIELEIENVRGITHLKLVPSGRNMVISGRNGSGKSAVVDAIDFLLTGGISRLTGEGTGGITLQKHGPHVDHQPAEAIVKALIQIHGVAEPIEISRCMAHPKDLIVEERYRLKLQPILSLASRNQHILTRREILQYITADGNSRADQIQKLLNIKDIEDIRKTLVKVENDADKNLRSFQSVVTSAKAAISGNINIIVFDSDQVLQIINNNRKILGGDQINKLDSALIKKDIVLPSAKHGIQQLNTTAVMNNLNSLKRVLDPDFQAQNQRTNSQLQVLINSVPKDPKIRRDISLLNLLSLGLELVDDSGVCPLCESTWEPEKLKASIDNRLNKAKSAQSLGENIAIHSGELSSRVSTIRQSLQQIITICKQFEQKEDIDVLEKWDGSLQIFFNQLINPIDEYVNSQITSHQAAVLLAPDGIGVILENVTNLINERFSYITPEQAAWDLLTRLEENIKALERASKDLECGRLYLKRAILLKNAYEQARNAVLGNLYDEIRERFEGLYRSLHGEDEKDFKAKLEPDGAALKLEVDFYGRGTNPPHALHSEGHQDSMGLCLYLALAERLTGGVLDLIILDDVVMSVDSEHRKQLCSLLVTEFQHRQFLITTHDKNWTNQLKADGVVRSKDSIEFFNWCVETGPQVNSETELWDQIRNDLGREDIRSAAAHLRGGSEAFFSQVCDKLCAPVVFKLNGRWELGDLSPAAISQYKNYLKMAKAASNSWNRQSEVDRINEIDSIASQIVARTFAEQWEINTSLHYNNWENLARNDFQPVVDAFQDLFGLFVCSQCGSLLFVEMKGTEPGSLRCTCGLLNWNLIPKK